MRILLIDPDGTEAKKNKEMHERNKLFVGRTECLPLLSKKARTP